MAKISKYFSEAEMECHGDNCCHHSAPMDRSFMEKMDSIRASFGKPIHPTCGFRCYKHNAEVGGVDTSWHTKGRALDCTVDDKNDLYKLEAIAKNFCREVIYYHDKNFVHIADE